MYSILMEKLSEDRYLQYLSDSISPAYSIFRSFSQLKLIPVSGPKATLCPQTIKKLEASDLEERRVDFWRNIYIEDIIQTYYEELNRCCA